MEGVSEFIQSILNGPMGKQFAEAMKHVEEEKARLGPEEYERRRIAEQEEENRKYFRRRMVDAVENMAGSRLKECSFKNFEVNGNNREAYDKCRDLAVNFKPERKGVLLTGSNGIGKNHLAIAVCRYLAEHTVPTFYASATTLKNRMYDSLSGGGVEDVVDKIISARLICINDLGAEYDTGFVKEFIFHLVDRIYEDNRVLFISTNLSDEELFKRYESRVMSRVLGMCDAVFYEDEDHRLRRNV